MREPMNNRRQPLKGLSSAARSKAADITRARNALAPHEERCLEDIAQAADRQGCAPWPQRGPTCNHAFNNFAKGR
eukprot:9051241-Alexandrium_andersonii.AAC.1